METTPPNFEVETTGEHTFSSEDAERILFAELPHTSSNSRTPRDLYHNLLNLKKKEIDLLLHGTYLSSYHRQKLIPRGFRIRNIPTLGRANSDFCSKWCKILNKCSSDLLLLVVEYVGKDLKQTQGEIEEFEAQNLINLTQDKTLDWIKNLETNVLKYKQELVAFKENKLQIVKEDYRQKRVYRWLLGLPERRERRTFRKYKPSSLMTVDSSGDSTDSDQGNRTSITQPFLGNTPPTQTGPREEGGEPSGGEARRTVDKPPRRGRKKM